ncbi:hypothetical protein [Niabella hibiscisoli]|nr:hypothetical protein [Niabella hibiscisoli]
MLFKIFADIDVFDIEINEKDPVKFVEIVQALEPTFGGINLEDIKAPGCFYIERELKKRLKIPVMHDDQHGTAIISAAALLNALEIQKKKIEKAKFVVNGAVPLPWPVYCYTNKWALNQKTLSCSTVRALCTKAALDWMILKPPSPLHLKTFH